MNHDRRRIIQTLPAIAAGGYLADMAAASDKSRDEPASSKKVTAGASPNYSRTVQFERTLYVAGVLGTDPQTRKLAGADFDSQCRQALANLKASVEAGGSTLGQVLKCTCFLIEAADFENMNKIYREYFASDPPARSTVVVKELVLAGAKIEIDCIAHI